MIPSWAGSAVQNYKRMFKERYGRETTLHDEDVFHIFETIYDDNSSEAQDVARVEVMKEREE